MATNRRRWNNPRDKSRLITVAKQVTQEMRATKLFDPKERDLIVTMLDAAAAHVESPTKAKRAALILASRAVLKLERVLDGDK